MEEGAFGPLLRVRVPKRVDLGGESGFDVARRLTGDGGDGLQ